MRGKLVVGNWKMNGGLRQNDALLAALRVGWTAPPTRELAVCVPYPYLWQAQAALSGSAIAWGAQNVSEHAAGAFEEQAVEEVVAELGDESSEQEPDGDLLVEHLPVAAEVVRDIRPGRERGQPLAEREAGTTETIVLRQLDAVAARLGERIGAVVIAYEPVWAIGTGRTASPAEAQAVHRLLRKRLTGAHDAAGDVLLLYGGSVKADNAKALFAGADIDGALVGGASLKADEFLAIAHA